LASIEDTSRAVSALSQPLSVALGRSSRAGSAVVTIDVLERNSVAWIVAAASGFRAADFACISEQSDRQPTGAIGAHRVTHHGNLVSTDEDKWTGCLV
jgi:hypothetical protein